MEMKIDETGQSVVPILACVLGQLCKRNDKIPLDPACISKFHAMRPPAISILNYLERIAKYAACSGECFVLALIFVDRIIQFNPTFVVNSLNIHRLLITAVMLSAKYFDDQYFNNAYYAKVGGVPCLEVNSLEVEFLFMINFTLFVSTETYTQYYTELSNHALHSNACSCSGLRVPPLKLDHLNLLVPITYHKVISKSPRPALPVSSNSSSSDSSLAPVAVAAANPHPVSALSAHFASQPRGQQGQHSSMAVESDGHGQPNQQQSQQQLQASAAMLTETSPAPTASGIRTNFQIHVT